MFNLYILFKWIKTPEADKITETAGKKAWVSFWQNTQKLT